MNDTEMILSFIEDRIDHSKNNEAKFELLYIKQYINEMLNVRKALLNPGEWYYGPN